MQDSEPVGGDSPQIQKHKRDTMILRAKVGAVFLAVVALVGVLVWQVPSLQLGWTGSETYETRYERNEYVRFNMEVFDIITENYWQEVNQADLAELFRLGLAQAMGGTGEELLSADRRGVAAMFSRGMKRVASESRRAVTVDTAIVVLDNLYPQGRSGLLSDKQETEFRDNVGNIRRDRDLYETIGIDRDAGAEELEEAFLERKAVLEEDDSEEAREALEELAYAREVLSDRNTRMIYDETQMEPSVSSRRTTSGTLYLDMRNITPATFQEIVGRLEGMDESSVPSGIIIDLRGNVGGALDFARFFFALFVGPNQYAYDLFQQGELNPERTPAIARVEALDAVEDIAILTDGQTQSTAELLTSIFKRFNRGKSVGEKTLGWGTVENTFPIKTTFDELETYSVLLVHSLTVRYDGEAIEQNGVEPDVDTSEIGWQDRLSEVFKSNAFTRDVQSALRGEI